MWVTFTHELVVMTSWERDTINIALFPPSFSLFLPFFLYPLFLRLFFPPPLPLFLHPSFVSFSLYTCILPPTLPPSLPPVLPLYLLLPSFIPSSFPSSLHSVYVCVQIIKASSSAGPESLNILHEAILFWSYQQTAHTSRVRGVVGEGWGEGRGEEEEENFSPTIYERFDKNTILAPFLR